MKMETVVCFDGIYYIVKKIFTRLSTDIEPQYLEESNCPCDTWTRCEIKTSDSEIFNKIVFDDIVKMGMR